METQGHAARALWNLLHAWWTMSSENRRVSLADADAAIRQARKDLPWLAVLPAQAAQQVLKAYFRAWQNCWAGRTGPPVFKSRLRARMCVDVPQGRDLAIERLTRTWGAVRIPKVGVVRFRWTKDLPVGKHADAANRVTGARLVREANGWHVVLRVRTEVKEPAPHVGPGVGIDRGVAQPLALSDGTFREHGPWLSPGEGGRLRRLECTAARQRRQRTPGQPSSHRLRRTYDQIARVRAKAKRRALDWQHKVTHALAQEFGVVGVEDLHIAGMVRSARGTVEAPGTNVARKSGLNRAIAGQAWGRTITLLEYKLADRGGYLVRVPAPYTSRRCSARQAITEGSRESRDRFVCKAPGCGHTAHADTNAARNIEHAVRQQAPQDIVGARTWSPRRQAGCEA